MKMIHVIHSLYIRYTFVILSLYIRYTLMLKLVDLYLYFSIITILLQLPIKSLQFCYQIITFTNHYSFFCSPSFVLLLLFSFLPLSLHH